MSSTVLVDEAAGETRAALFDDQGQAILLAIERWSAWQTRAIEGEIHAGKVIEVHAGTNAAFVELAKGDAGFLPFGKKGRPAGLHEGAWVQVKITREAMPAKGPNLCILAPGERLDAPSGKLELLASAPSIVERMNVPKGTQIRSADRSGREMIDAAVDEALQEVLPIAGGGDIAIEPTRALIAIDVDTGSNQASPGRVNYLAAQLAFRQMRLRSLGGIIAIDFAPMRSKNEKAALLAALEKLVRLDPARVDMAPLSRFGVLELIRRRNTRSIAEIMLDSAGRLSIETQCLQAIRQLQNEALAQAGKQMHLVLSKPLNEWLHQSETGWQKALQNEIGPRFKVTSGAPKGRNNWEIVVV